MVQEQLTAEQRVSVFSVVSPDLFQHSVWRNRYGEVWTQCGMFAVSATGYVRPEWEAAYPGNTAGTPWRCRKCQRAM